MRCIRGLLYRAAGFRRFLRTHARQAANVKLIQAASGTTLRESDVLPNQATVHVVHTWRAEYLQGMGLSVALLCPIALVVYVIIDSWWNHPSNRSWLILGLGFYIGAALKVIYEALVRVFDRLWFLRVEIRRVNCPSLFEAVSHVLALDAELSDEACSRDCEAFQQHDPVTGQFSVLLSFWGTRARTRRIRVSVGGKNETPAWQLPLLVEYSPGSDIVCGRDSRLQSQATLVLSTPTTKQRVRQDKVLLRHWLEQSYKTWTQPADGVVKVYALQQASTDWTPEWKLERVKPCKSSTGTGQAFYLERDSLQRLVADAKLWSSLSLRVYMVSGPPGVGKSEFIIWLASQLGLSIYRLSLSSSNLSDNLLAQILSQTSISDDNVLVQVDEFQESLQRWVAAAENGNQIQGVTAGGFCECIQGATAMRSGVVILSGTSAITTESVQRTLAAVYRRIHCTAELTWMTQRDVRSYFKNFLLHFLPGASLQDWIEWEKQFMQDSPWAESRPISIDMLKQFLMSRITDASVKDIGNFASSTANTFQVSVEQRSSFFRLICDTQRATQFLDAYAPVEHDANEGPGVAMAHVPLEAGGQESDVYTDDSFGPDWAA